MKGGLYVRTTCSTRVWSDNCLAVFIPPGAHLLVGFCTLDLLDVVKKLDLGQTGATSACDVAGGGLGSADKQFCPVVPIAKVKQLCRRHSK